VSTDGIHFVFFFSFDEFIRLRDEVQAEFRSLLVWGEERSVENAMHFPSWWETKAIGVWGDNLRDFKRAFSLRGQLSAREIDLQVTGVEPDLCSYFPRGEFCSDLLFDCLGGLSVGSSSLFVSSIQKFESFIKGREEHLPNGWVGSGFKTHHK